MSQDKYHLGKRIEAILHKQGMSKAEFGRRISTSRQNVNTLLRREFLSTDLVMMASRALRHNFFEELAGLVPKEANPGLLHTSGHPEVLIAMRKRPGTSFLQIVDFLQHNFPKQAHQNEAFEQPPVVLDRIYFGLGSLGQPD